MALLLLFLIFLLLLVILTVPLEQVAQVLLQGIRLQSVRGVVQTFQVYMLPLGIPHHGPLLAA